MLLRVNAVCLCLIYRVRSLYEGIMVQELSYRGVFIERKRDNVDRKWHTYNSISTSRAMWTCGNTEIGRHEIVSRNKQSHLYLIMFLLHEDSMIIHKNWQAGLNIYSVLFSVCLMQYNKNNNNGRNGSLFLRGWLPYRGKAQMACNYCFPTRTMF